MTLAAYQDRCHRLGMKVTEWAGRKAASRAFSRRRLFGRVAAQGATQCERRRTGDDRHDDLAERYVKMVLALGQTIRLAMHYYARTREEGGGRPEAAVDDLAERARALQEAVSATPAPARTWIGLRRQISNANCRRSPTNTDAQGRAAIVRRGSRARCTTRSRRRSEATYRRSSISWNRSSRTTVLSVALRGFRRALWFHGRLDAVFQTAIQACRERTEAHLRASNGALHRRVRHEEVLERLQLVPGELPQPDSGQHELPIYIDRAIDLACHEGYPGLTSTNVRLEKHLVARPEVDRVFGVSAVLAQSLIAEGTAQLWHRGGVSRTGTGGVRESRALPAAGLDGAAPRIIRRAGAGRSLAHTPGMKRRAAI